MDRRIRDDFKNSPIRSMVLAGESYEEDPLRLKENIRGYFREPAGPGDPSEIGSKPRLVGTIAPHIDFRRGGNCYAFAHKAIRESAEADLVSDSGYGPRAHQNALRPDAQAFRNPLGHG